MERMVKWIAPKGVFDFVLKAFLFLFAISSLNHLRSIVEHGPASEPFLRITLETAIVGGPFIILALSIVKHLNDLQDRLFAQAHTDDLTGLPNRRAFLDALDLALDQSAPEGTLLLLDIDHFKSVNDTYGHGVGDKALRAFAEVIKGAVGDAHPVGRLGGEEFAVLYLGTDTTRMQSMADAIITGLTLLPPDVPEPLLITCSIGAADLEPGVTSSAILRDADIALYAAKQAGRGRLVALGENLIEQMMKKGATVH